MIFALLITFPPVSSCVPSLCTPNLDFERGGCWRTRVTHDRQTVFLTNECQTLEGVDHSRNRQSKAHSFCFSRKLKPTSVAQESKRQVMIPNTHFSLCACGTNAIGVVCALCEKNRGKGLFCCCLFCRNEAVIVSSVAFSIPVSFACCGHPTAAASEFCTSSLLNS